MLPEGSSPGMQEGIEMNTWANLTMTMLALTILKMAGGQGAWYIDCKH